VPDDDRGLMFLDAEHQFVRVRRDRERATTRAQRRFRIFLELNQRPGGVGIGVDVES
jgi:hypothetical protein